MSIETITAERFYEKAKEMMEDKKDEIWSFLKEKAVDLWNKSKVDFGTAFMDYSERAFDKYCKIKTILYKNQPRFLYDFFECNDLLLDDKTIDCEDVNNILEYSHCNLIVGNGGMGKSTLMKHFFLNALEHDKYIPIFIELKGYNGSENLLDYCYESIHSLGFALEQKYFEYALESGMFLILLDGYDEIMDENKGEFFKTFQTLIDNYPDNYYIVSSRLCQEFIGWSRFYRFETKEFSKEKAINLIKKIDYDDGVKSKFIKNLDEDLYKKHKSFVSNPLLLNIMLLTYENYAEIPDKLHIFYSHAFDTLFAIHDATKSDGFKRDIKSKLPSDVFKQVFSSFCISSYMKGKIEFTHEEILEELKMSGKKVENFNAEDFLEDLKYGVCLMFLDGLKYTFIHRSFQEYFSAVYLKNLSRDDFYGRACRSIIKNRKLDFDSVFSMLRDMNQLRFEKNVIMPLLNEVENQINDNSNREKDYYCYLVKYATVYRPLYANDLEEHDDDIKYEWTVHFMENNIKLGMILNEYYFFLYWVYCKYYPKCKYHSEGEISDKYVNIEMTKENIYQHIDLFNEIMNKTVIGDWVRTLSSLFEILNKQQQEAEEEMNYLFE